MHKYILFYFLLLCVSKQAYTSRDPAKIYISQEERIEKLEATVINLKKTLEEQAHVIVSLMEHTQEQARTIAQQNDDIKGLTNFCIHYSGIGEKLSNLLEAIKHRNSLESNYV